MDTLDPREQEARKHALLAELRELNVLDETRSQILVDNLLSRGLPVDTKNEFVQNQFGIEDEDEEMILEARTFEEYTRQKYRKMDSGDQVADFILTHSDSKVVERFNTAANEFNQARAAWLADKNEQTYNALKAAYEKGKALFS